LNEKSRLLNEKLRIKTNEQQAKNDAFKDLKEKMDKEVQLRTWLSESSKLQVEALNKYKESALKDREKVVELEDVNKKLEKRMQEIGAENSKHFKEIGALKRELQIANEDRALLQKRLSRIGSASSATYEEEILAYKKMLRCSVCDDRPKSAIITTCCHLFCRECINLNLKSRNRKCPGCKKMFGENDVHSVYF
jgi:E3 ubiquitin-protein ligase BRE1